MHENELISVRGILTCIDVRPLECIYFQFLMLFKKFTRMHDALSTVKRQGRTEAISLATYGRLHQLSRMLRYSLISLRFLCLVFTCHFSQQICHFVQCISSVFVLWAEQFLLDFKRLVKLVQSRLEISLND